MVRRWWVAALCVALAGGVRAATLQSLDVGGDGSVVVTLRLTSPTVPWARSLAGRHDTPPRIYVDLPDTTLGASLPRELPVDAGPVRRLRTGQFSPTTARVVLDLARSVPFDVRAQGRTVEIRLEAAAGIGPATPPADAPPVIVIDAGHGGHDPGAAGVDGTVEKTVVLQIAHRLAAKLPARLPVDSLLTRSDDTFVPLQRRLPPQDARRAVFVSLHANACSDPRPEGFEIYHAAERGDARRAGSALLATTVTEALRARFVRVRGDPRVGTFTVLAANPAPSVLIELGYLTHGAEAARLRDPHYQELITDALVDGVAAYLQAFEGPRLAAAAHGPG